jgi:hypothetical protein
MKNQNGLALFNAMKEEAKSLGIDVTGMKKVEIEAAIVAKQEEFVTQNTDDVEPQTDDVVINITNEGVTKSTRPGRPVNLDSVRQKMLAEKQRLREDGLLRRGRPSVEGSARQARMQARAEKIAAGIQIKPGRPKVIKENVVVS